MTRGFPSRRLVVTGSAGFVARHFIEHIDNTANGPRSVIGFDIRPATSLTGHIECDLTNPESIRTCLREAEPDVVVHFAGVTQGTDLDPYLRVNVVGTHNLLQAAAALPIPPLIVTIGSAAQYGATSGTDVILTEESPQLARGAYGLSKVFQEKWAALFAATTNVPIVGVRIFNIIGPGEPDHLVPGAFLSQVAEVVAGKRSQVEVGNVETRRDFIDVRDVARAIWNLIGAYEPSVKGQFYNVASGKAVRIRDLIDASVALSGHAIPIVVDATRLRANDVACVIGDSSKLLALTGWRPTIPWRESIAAAWNGRT